MISNVSGVITRGWLEQFRRTYVYAGLFTSEPLGFSVFGEVSGSGYTRQPIFWSEILSGGIVQNANSITWSGIDAGTTVAAVAIFATQTGKDIAAYGMLARPRVIRLGSPDVALRNSVGTFTIEKEEIAFRVY